MKQEKLIIAIFCILGITGLIQVIPVHATNPAEDGKWDFTITSISANPTSASDHMLLQVGVIFTGTENTGTVDVTFIDDVKKSQITKTISNIKQNQTRFTEFEYVANCKMDSVMIKATTPNFKGSHVFDEKNLFIVPYQDTCLGINPNKSDSNTNISQGGDPAIESFVISDHSLTMKKGKIHYVTFHGYIAESKFVRGPDLWVLMTKPDGTKDSLRFQITSSGKFETPLRFDFDHSIPGKYTFEPMYLNRYHSNTIELTVFKSYS